MDLDYLRSDDSFRHDCARYTESVENEQFDVDWLREAWIAHEKRKRGDFREYLVEKMERDWEVRIPRGGEEGGGEVVLGEAGEKGRAEGKEVEGGTSRASSGTLGENASVASSVGENRFTELRLELVPDGKVDAAVAVKGGGGRERGKIVVAS